MLMRSIIIVLRRSLMRSVKQRGGNQGGMTKVLGMRGWEKGICKEPVSLVLGWLGISLPIVSVKGE
jgi:hypothetical protein